MAKPASQGGTLAPEQAVTFERLSIADGLSQSVVTAIVQDQQGFMWFGTQGGLNRYDGYQFTVYKHDPDDPTTLSNNQVNVIYVDRRGELWIGTDRGLDRFDRATGTFAHYQHSLDDPQSLSVGAVRAVYEDSRGTLWVGTTGGLNRLDRTAQTFIHYQHTPGDPTTLSNDAVWAIHEDESGELWIGTNGGMNRFDRRTETFVSFQHNPDDPTSLSNNDVRAILKDRDGTLWVGTDLGLDRLEPQTEAFIHHPSFEGTRVTALTEDGSGRLWIGTSAGLYRLDRATGALEAYHPYGLSGSYITAIYDDRAGAVWVGTYGGGIYVWNDVDGQFTHYSHVSDNPQSLSSNIVLAFYRDPTLDEGASPLGEPVEPQGLDEGTVWIGTEEGGLNRLDRSTQTFTRYTEEDGLPGDTAVCILADPDGCLWLGTNKGLSRFDPQTETFRNYGVRDGLQGSEFIDGACFQSEHGEMFFGGFQGLNAFYPGQIKPNLHAPPIVITAFKKYNQTLRTDLSADEHIQLSYRDDFI